MIVRAPGNGFVIAIDIDAIGEAVRGSSASVEIVLLCSIGTYMAYQDALAEVRTASADVATSIPEAVEHAITLDRQRNLDKDPAYGIEQLETIAWRSISTSQQNPAPGLVAIQNMRDLLARWAVADEEEPAHERLPVVYPDNVMMRLFGALESLCVVASESMQHQTYAEIMSSISGVFERLSAAEQEVAVTLLLRAISALGDHVLTTQLDDAMTELIRTVERAGHAEAAAAIRTALEQLRMSVGQLNSRSTRVPSAG